MGCCEAAVARFFDYLHDLRRRSQNPTVIAISAARKLHGLSMLSAGDRYDETTPHAPGWRHAILCHHH